MLLLTACGASQITPPTASAGAELIGTWRSPCVRKTVPDGRLGQPQIETFTFTGNKLTDDIKFFSTTDALNCLTVRDLWEVEYSADVTIGKTVLPGTSTRHTQINITRTKVRFRARKNGYNSELNRSSDILGRDPKYNSYGQTGWVEDQWKDLTSIPDARTNFNIDTVLPDIFQISNRQINGNTQKILTWGNKDGNLDRDQRPLTLENKDSAAVRQSAN